MTELFNAYVNSVWFDVVMALSVAGVITRWFFKHYEIVQDD